VTKFSVIAISAEALIGAEVVEGGAAEKYRVDVPGIGAVILKNRQFKSEVQRLGVFP
jgi:hypothetical protein